MSANFRSPGYRGTEVESPEPMRVRLAWEAYQDTRKKKKKKQKTRNNLDSKVVNIQF